MESVLRDTFFCVSEGNFGIEGLVVFMPSKESSWITEKYGN
jgi:hypothetical protein